MLDPHPNNELGKGILDPAMEKRLIEGGFVFAYRITQPNGHTFIGAYRKPVIESIIEQVASIRAIALRPPNKYEPNYTVDTQPVAPQVGAD